MAVAALTIARQADGAVNTLGLLAAMTVAVAAVTGLAAWGERREAEASLDRLAAEQLRIARLVAQVEGEHADLASSTTRAVEQIGDATVLLRGTREPSFRTRGGAILPRELIHGPKGSIDRDHARALGLPRRMAVVGIAPLPGDAGEVAVVATAGPARDYELHARARLIATVVVAAGLVLSFGGLAMRTQRREMELGHRLALMDLEQTRGEQLRKADRLATMGALASGVAHEVATPLGVILARAEQLAARVDDERSTRAVRVIVEQTERIDAVVRRFLDLSRGQRPVFRAESPRAMVGEACALVLPRFERARVALDVDAGGVEEPLLCEPLLVEHVLVNLLSNACDACSPGGHVTIAVSTSEGSTTFRVEDDGVGISEEQAARAKEPFFTTKAERGTGIGLAIAAEIVEHHRGRLSLAPREGGRGTTATVELPRRPPGDA